MNATRQRSQATLILLLAAAATPLPAAGSSPAAQAIASAMIEAHGGLERWAAAPTVAFTDEFIQPDATSGFPARVVVEQGRRRAYIDYAGTLQLAWDGEKAWSAGSQPPLPPRFLALLNYYFLNLPWLTHDPGVVLGDPGSGKLWDDPTEYTTLRMTFEAGIGDTPDDAYVLYIHPETHRLEANEYIVTYKALLPEGAAATDPHILVYDEWTRSTAWWCRPATPSTSSTGRSTSPAWCVTGRSASRGTSNGWRCPKAR